MRKFILIGGLTLILFTACQEKHEQRYFAESAEIEVLKAGISAYESADWDVWKGHFADTAKIYVNSKESITVDARIEGLKATTTAFSSYGFDRSDEYTEMVIDKEKETWVYYWAQHEGTLAANNKQISFPVHLAVQFADGKIVTEHIYFDGTEMNNALEAIAAEAAAEEPESE